MRKISKLIVLAVVFLFATQAFALSAKNGVYQIGSCQDLIDFAKKVNQGTSNIDAVLTQSIDMSECSEKYPMIGNEYKFLFVNHRYRGTFDGQNYVISNLAIDTVAQNVGLFGAIEGATIKNVVLQNVAIKASGNIDSPDQPVSVGGLVGWMNGGSIENCFVSGSISTNGEGNGVGSVVGYASNGSISNCMGDVKLTAYGQNVYIGGIAGYAEAADISSCVYAGKSITNGGNGTNGGIVGSTQNPASTKAYKPTFSNAYYDTDVVNKGVGKGYAKAPTSGVADLNSDEVACALNGGVMKKSVCNETGLWSNEGGRLSFNGMVTDDEGNILYLLQFNANGGKFESGARNNVFLKHGATISADGLAVPTKDGFTFVGWAFDAAADEPVELGAMPAAKTVVYAVWKKMVRVTFVANSRAAANATFADGSQMASKLVNYNGQITSEGIDQPLDYSEGEGDSKTYYTFIGWSPVNGATEAENLGVATEEKTVYAVWKNTYVTYYTVSFDNMGHGTTPSAIRVEENNGVVAPAEPSEEGYVFDGWFASEDLSGEAYDFATPVTSNVTLYAKWSLKKYSISYMNMEDADVDEINPSEYTIESDEIVLAVPTWTGHTFGGWYSDENFASRVTSIATGSTGDKVLFAKWSVSTYTISYAPGNYGYGSVSDDTKIYDEDLTLSKETFIPSDKAFIQTGWALTDGGEKVYELGAVYTENKSITLFPYWVASRYNVEYIVDIKNSKGELLKTETYLTEQDIVGNTHTIAAAAVMEGYTFSGWTVVTEVADLNEGKFTMPEGDVVIKGEFVADEDEDIDSSSSESDEDSSSSEESGVSSSSGEGEDADSSDSESGDSSSSGEGEDADSSDSESGDSSSSGEGEDADSSDSESDDSSSSGEGEDADSSDSENGSDSDSEAISTIAMHSFGLHVSGRTLEISNAKIGANLLVVDMKGRLVRKATVNAADMRIALPQAGGYIVRVGNQVKRVVVR